MRSLDEHRDPLAANSFRELRLLEEVDSTAELSQRKLARKLGIALGVANLSLRNLASQGYLRISRAGWQRWVYSLTPSGVARKVHLTLDYVDNFLSHYTRVRGMLREELASLPLPEGSRVAIYSTSDLAELVYLALKEIGVAEIDIFDSGGAKSRFLGMPVRHLSTIDTGSYAMVVLADSGDVAARREELGAAGVHDGQIVTLMRNGRSLPGSRIGSEGSA